MDEGQKIYPTRLRTLSEFDYHADEERPATVEQAFDEHRHYNWDIYISTTNVAKIHKEIRQVTEVAYRHRDLSNILPFSKNKWREVAHDPENSGKSVSHVISTAKHKAGKRVFNCYQSTKTGKATHSSEDRSIFSDGRLRFIGIVLLCAVVFLVYSGITFYKKKVGQNNDVETHQVYYQDDKANKPLSLGDVGNHLSTEIHYQDDDVTYEFNVMIQNKKISNMAHFIVRDNHNNMGLPLIEWVDYCKGYER